VWVGDDPGAFLRKDLLFRHVGSYSPEHRPRKRLSRHALRTTCRAPSPPTWRSRNRRPSHRLRAFLRLFESDEPGISRCLAGPAEYIPRRLTPTCNPRGPTLSPAPCRPTLRRPPGTIETDRRKRRLMTVLYWALMRIRLALPLEPCSRSSSTRGRGFALFQSFFFSSIPCHLFSQ